MESLRLAWAPGQGELRGDNSSISTVTPTPQNQDRQQQSRAERRELIIRASDVLFAGSVTCLRIWCSLLPPPPTVEVQGHKSSPALEHMGVRLSSSPQWVPSPVQTYLLGLMANTLCLSQEGHFQRENLEVREVMMGS